MPRIHLGFALVAVIYIASGCKTTSNNPYLTEGNEYAKDGLLREAAESYRRALATQPNLLTAHRNLGMVLVKAGDYSNATAHLEQSLPRYENDFETNYYLGEAYRAQNRFADAIFRYQKSLKVKTDEPRALKSLAWSYFKIRYYSEALVTGRRLMEITPRDEQAIIIVARTLLKSKNADEALILVRSTRSKIPSSSAPYFLSVEGDVLLELGQTDGAMKAYKDALKDQPMLAGALLGQGRLLLQQGKTEGAIISLERSVRIRPQLTEAYYLLGQAYMNSDRQKSLAYYQTFRKQAAHDPEFLTEMSTVNKTIGVANSNEAQNQNPAR